MNKKVLESYKDAIKYFSNKTNKVLVLKFINRFKRLNRNNKLTGRKKDIGYWMDKPFGDFKDYVEEMENKVTKRQQKFNTKKETLKVTTEQYTAVLPLTKAQAILYGKNTKWCISGTKDNAFYNQFFTMMAAMIIVIQNNKKYCLVSNSHLSNVRGVYDDKDEFMDKREFEQETGLDSNEILSHFKEYADIITSYHKDINTVPKELHEEIIVDEPLLISRFKEPSETMLWTSLHSKPMMPEKHASLLTHDMIKYLVQHTEQAPLPRKLIANKNFRNDPKLHLAAIKHDRHSYAYISQIIGTNKKLNDLQMKLWGDLPDEGKVIDRMRGYDEKEVELRYNKRMEKKKKEQEKLAGLAAQRQKEMDDYWAQKANDAPTVVSRAMPPSHDYQNDNDWDIPVQEDIVTIYKNKNYWKDKVR